MGRGCPLPPTRHTWQRQRLHILIYKCYTPANTHSHLPLLLATLSSCLCCKLSNVIWAVSIHGPSNIITYLFAETPSPKVVEKLTALFAGNGVPKTLAYKFYGVCIPEAATELVRQLFYARFSLWHFSDTVRRYSMYYDVRIKRHVRLNLPYSTELLAIRENPVAVPGWPAPKWGVANTATPTMINAALRLVSQKQL